ncbi:contactin-like [Mya arenaria]|uniref:contactin-like n=1 Tax=Mya arenaria TaxID=6604 RepID=UPI0022E24FD3|nr:contactin-like [Mya arenaria]
MDVRWLMVVVCLTGDVTAQLIGCPLQWESYGDSCYQFVYSTVMTYEEAASACWIQGSALVSVNDGAEFRFIQEFLGSHVQDKDTHWYTSGRYVSGVVTWGGDGTSTNNTRDDSYWILPRYYAYTYFGNRLVYSFSLSRSQFAWSVVIGYDPYNYICEIPRREVGRIIQQHRGFAFGYGNLSYNEVPKGPKFMNLPQNEVITDSILPLLMDCLASGTPQPSYKWYIMNPQMGNNSKENYTELTTGGGSKLTLSNGRLTVTKPEERADTGTYVCEATNSQGSILSPPIEISFGYLDQFSPNQVGFVQALLMKGTFINCNAPSAKPALSYQWYKDDIRNFVRPELNKYFFISDNGNLYFSEVQETDRGNYYCVVTLIPRVNEILISHQPVSRSSRPIELRIIGNPSLDYGPIIHPDFIAVFPKPPIVGHNVRLECFAYGRLPMQYSWSRANGRQFPAGTYFMYENRVLIIPKAQFDATGNYTCHVQKRTGTQATDTRSFFLTLEAYPYFVFPLHDMHADVNSELTWRCEARAIPAATYTWYKNSKRLQHVPGQVEIRRNVLYIRSLDKSRDEGMYQCEAANAHGTNKTSAELRVLSFPPNFNRRPLPRTAQAAEGGNLTLHCLPDAAPQADITWSQNGGQINPDGRREVFWDGSLRVTQVSGGDAGTYTCQASNIYGEAHSNTAVTVLPGIRWQTKPTNRNGNVNTTVFLFCEASYDVTKYDLTYIWKFNGRNINTTHDFFYQIGGRQNVPGLYIRNAQYWHTGAYECVAQTVLIAISASAFVNILGPPSQPAGVFVVGNPGGPPVNSPGSQTQNASSIARVMWTWNPAAEHGFPAIFFHIEARSELGGVWEYIAYDVPTQMTVTDVEMRHFYDVYDILPYNSYQFRVRAACQVGTGPPSRPSSYFKVPMAPPRVAPSYVTGGNGSVGLLTIKWEPLRRDQEGGPDFGYRVFWQRKGDSRKIFAEADVGRKTQHSVTVGLDNFYLPYSVKVQAYNRMGDGPLSDLTTVYSAEAMPPTRPSKLQYLPINGTAVTVTWNQVPSTREAAGGVVLGYQIDYQDAYNPNGQKNRVFVYCTCGQGNIVGLDPNSHYWVNVEVFNSAGRSVPSEKYLVETYESPASRYPQFVEVLPDTEHSARVKWRGVNILQNEGTLYGYKLMYWPVSDDLRTANFTEVGIVNEAVINGLQTDIIYRLRVMAVNRGGDGRKSPTLYFSIIKGGGINLNRANFDPTTSEILFLSSASSISAHILLTMVTVLACVCKWTL